ncbi:MAG: release factor glutamine methyltransferase [Bacteroidia bacterium]|jgi:release factor glutamine methyltransferase
MACVQELLRSAADLPSESPRRDAEILLCYALGKSRSWLYAWPEYVLQPDESARYESLLQQRRLGEPVAYLTGEREFWSLTLKVDQRTLIPRPETETLVAWALELPVPDHAAVLDLGTGSGAIALALASERSGWQVLAIDRSADALAVARANATGAGLARVEFLQSDWFAALLGQRYHLILANPPYVAQDDPHLGVGDVRFEPRAALVADDSGMADLALLIQGAPMHLAGGAWLLLEHGYQQADAVRTLLRETGFTQVATRCDLAGQERITGGCFGAD